MLTLNELKPAKGAKKRKKVVGRGPGSGHGKTSCRGHKGQKARTGKGKRPGFEGGQMPLIRRIPKRGFTNKFKKEFQIVNVGSFGKCKEDAVITPKEMYEMGVVPRKNIPVKVLGGGKLKKRITIKAEAFSKGAIKAIEEAGGKTEKINA